MVCFSLLGGGEFRIPNPLMRSWLSRFDAGFLNPRRAAKGIGVIKGRESLRELADPNFGATAGALGIGDHA